ncbi:MAG TPA: hypothetical protein VI136_09520 [Verrucomicrobiae bacterium]
MKWACECGIVNDYCEPECGQCGQTRANGWAASDRETVFALRVIDVSPPLRRRRGERDCHDVCYQLPPDCEFVNPVLRSLCHQPFLKN